MCSEQVGFGEVSTEGESEMRRVGWSPVGVSKFVWNVEPGARAWWRLGKPKRVGSV